MIRTLLIASLATLAATEADADPYLVYGGYPFTHGLTYGAYNPYYTLPVVKAVDAEEKKTVVPLHYPINYGYNGHPLTQYYGKREATTDADAAADPWLTYGYAGYGHGLYRPYGYRAHYGGHLGYYGGYRTYGYPYYG